MKFQGNDFLLILCIIITLTAVVLLAYDKKPPKMSINHNDSFTSTGVQSSCDG